MRWIAYDDIPLSLEAIRFKLDEKSISKYVFQAKLNTDFTHKVYHAQLPTLYDNNYRTENKLDLNSYLKSETFSIISAAKQLILSANLYLNNNHVSLGCLNSTNASNAAACFLKHTNALYNEQDSKKHISYVINVLGYYNNIQ